MSTSQKIRVEFLTKGDVFFLEERVYTVTSNESISKSFNEINALCEKEDCNLRLRKNEELVLIKEKVVPKNTTNSIIKTRNETGNVVSVNFSGIDTISEGPDEWPSRTKRKKISKAQEKTRDDCAEDLMKKASFNKRYNKKKNVKAPAKSKSDVAYAICALQATGRGNQINRGRPCKDPPCHKEKKKTNEEFNRLNTLKNAIRRNLNEKI
jgi:hypothetical protein